VSEFAESFRVAHRGRSVERPVQVTDVVIVQLPDRLPQVRLGFRTKDLHRLAFPLGFGIDEPEATAPGTVGGPPQDERKVDQLAGEANRLELVLDGLMRIPGGRACRGL
jgi:hypothetical protein